MERADSDPTLVQAMKSESVPERHRALIDAGARLGAAIRATSPVSGPHGQACRVGAGERA